MELSILDFIQNTFSCAFMDVIMPAISFFGNAGWVWILAGVVMAVIPKTRKIGITVCIALLLSLIVCNLTLKPIVNRIRPYDIKEGIELLITKPHDASFPSGHSSASFAAAVAMVLYNKKIGIPAVVLASLIAFSRLYLYVHFPTDVLGGIILGSLCAVGAYFIGKFVFKKIKI
ncbi:MAG: phosphatase PAP2 family protein [Clostridia bacterium]|nr:phosphatase PAP2 family protein [Clostridia bacterium]